MNWLNRFLSGRAEIPMSPSQRERLAAWQEMESADLGRSHFETRYVVVNTEASGLDLEQDRLLAVAAVAVEERALAPHAAYLANLAPDPAEALLGLLEFAGRAPLVVFNGAFNRTHLERATAQYLGVEPQAHWLDLYWLLPSLQPELSAHPLRLGDWMARAGVDTFLRHHALGDAWAISLLFLKALARATAMGMASPRDLMEAEHTFRQLRATF